MQLDFFDILGEGCCIFFYVKGRVQRNNTQEGLAFLKSSPPHNFHAVPKLKLHTQN